MMLAYQLGRKRLREVAIKSSAVELVCLNRPES